MKTKNTFWTTLLLLVALAIGGCSLELAQQEEAATGQPSQPPQEQEASK